MNRKLYLYLALLGVAAAPLLFEPPPESPPATAASVAHAQAAPAQPASKGTGPAALSVAPSKAPQGRIETDELRVRVSSVNGGITSAELKAARYAQGKAATNLVSTDRAEYLPLRIELDGVSDTQGFSLEQVGERGVRLSGVRDGVHVTRKIEAGSGPYQLWLTTRLENRGSAARKLRLSLATHHYVAREAEGSDFFLLPVRGPAISSGLCRHDGELERELREGLESKLAFGGNIQFAGVASTFFLNAIAPEHTADVERCTIEASNRGKNAEGEPLGSLFSSRLVHKSVELQPGQSRVYKTLAYLGPKEPDVLSVAGHGLKEAIESGWFASLAEGLTWLLRFIHDYVGNWGLAIILLTVLVKTALFPLTAKQINSMAKMKELKPEMDRINELYADDREKKGAAIMELYRKKGVNPMAGCFPVLLQLPIWFSLYASLSSNVELLHAPFMLWWTDLSSPDPYFVLPLLLGVLMFVQQKMAPATAMDPVQQKMMLYMMPIMMTSFMLFLPAGLCLYTLTNSALSIGQQRLIEARLKSIAPSDSAADAEGDSSSPSSADPDTSNISQRLRLNRPSKAERRSRRGKR